MLYPEYHKFINLIKCYEKAHVMNICIIYTTFPDLESAKKASEELFNERLIACCNLFPTTISMYVWDNELKVNNEVIMISKSTHDNFTDIERIILDNHPYDTPCIIEIPVSTGYMPFAQWITASVAQAHI